MDHKLSTLKIAAKYPFIYLFLIFISLTPKGKVSTEGKAYRRVTYKNKIKQNLQKQTIHLGNSIKSN